MIESIGPVQSYYQLCWSPATHIGVAIDRALSACVHLGIDNPIAREADFVDSLPANAVRKRQLKIWYAPTRYYFPSEKAFVAPAGIIASSEDGETDYKQIRAGFSLSKTAEGIFEVEAAIERDKLFDVYVELLKRLRSIKVFWIKLAADWEDRDREVFWTNENLNTIDSIRSFLTNHSTDTIVNGYVALTTYGAVGQTNLTIDTHKTIKILTKSARVQREMAASLKRCGFNELPEFHSLEHGYYHWHYRPTRSKSRKRLIAGLKNWGFKLWRAHQVEREAGTN
jgi:hypothetical protein